MNAVTAPSLGLEHTISALLAGQSIPLPEQQTHILVNVRVTRTDIQKGLDANTPGNAECCPVFQAIRRARVMVRYVGYYQIGLENAPSLDTPKKVYDWLDLFDRHQPVRGFTFPLLLPAGSLRERK